MCFAPIDDVPDDWNGLCAQCSPDDDEDDLEFCRDCGLLIDDGEGYAGRCGNCSDALENRRTERAPDSHLEMALEETVTGRVDVDRESF
ncbi:MAG: hypothetical protein M3Z22_07945 [Verrucomicrobiota bacterium]|nr:hypothetical protein [Verrucomicrobiota bacterium]